MSVSRLDLAPRLKRPLQLWNPLDYVRLLYWVFFFPQAVRWYVEVFAGGELPSEGAWWIFLEEKVWDWLSAAWSHPVRRHLLVQAQAMVGAILLGMMLPSLRFDGMGDWLFTLLGALCTFVMIFVVVSIASSMAAGIVSSVTAGLFIGMLLVPISLGIGTVLLIGLAYASVKSTTGGVKIDLARGTTRWFLFSILICVEIGIAGSVMYKVAPAQALMYKVAPQTMAEAAILGIVCGTAIALSSLRPEAWLAGLPSALRHTCPRTMVPRTTCLPLPGLRSCLRASLLEDWSVGLHNVDQLLRYSLQFVPVIGAVNDALAALPEEDLIQAVAQLAYQPYDWALVRLASVPLSQAIKTEIVDGFFFVPRRWRRRIQARWDAVPRPSTPTRAAAAGFWYLHEKEPGKAAEAFAVIRSLPQGEEMYRLACALAAADAVRDLPILIVPSQYTTTSGYRRGSSRLRRVWTEILPRYIEMKEINADKDISSLAKLPECPEFATINAEAIHTSLQPHPTAWKALANLQQVALDVQTVQRSVSHAIRAQALSRALGRLTSLLENADEVPEAERDLMQEIAVRWRNALLAVAGGVGQAAIAEPVTNPYVVGGPVVGPGFVGREDIVRRLEELWAGSEVPPSVVLFGHRRMGKTSILRNLPGHLGASVHLAYVNLLLLGDAPGGASEVLLALADGAARALREAGRAVPEPDPDAFQAHAYRAFEQYLRAVREGMGEERLILAVDEFEQLEEWMAEGRLPRDFLKVLRGYIQMEPTIAFAFAGLHTLEEMAADYFEPFFASVVPVKVRFLSRGAVLQLLANPSEDFPLDYDPEALEQVWQLTAGQPYLVQLVGHRLVSRFNDLAFERGQKPEPRFTVEDVEAVVGTPEFYQMGRYYFTGVWGQARQDPPGQQAVLRALASYLEGRTWEELVADTGLAEGTLGAAMAALEHHDVVVKEAGPWQYAVELMRRWVVREQE